MARFNIVEFQDHGIKRTFNGRVLPDGFSRLHFQLCQICCVLIWFFGSKLGTSFYHGRVQGNACIEAASLCSDSGAYL